MMLRQFEKADVLEIQGIDMDANPGYGPFMGVTLTEDDGKTILGYTCVHEVNGRDWLCFWWRPGTQRAAATLHRGAIKLFEALRGTFGEIYVICDSRYGEGSDKWMRRLGFSPLAEDEKDWEIKEYEHQLCGGAYKLWLR